MPATPTHLIVLRHGETDWNRVRRLQGHIDIALNAEGMRQAAMLGEALAREPLDKVLASDLIRARDTAHAIARHHRLPVHEDPHWRERCYGLCEGLTHGEIAERHPRHYHAWQQRDPNFVPLGGESLRHFGKRVERAVTELARREAGKRLVLVVHGGVLDVLYRLAQKLPLEAPRNFDLSNAAINRFEADASGLVLKQWGDKAHLETGGLDEVDGSQPPLGGLTP